MQINFSQKKPKRFHTQVFLVCVEKKYYTIMQCTVNIFGSKSGHLSNRIIERFSSFSPKSVLLYLMIFQDGEYQMCCRTWKNHQIQPIFQEKNEENLAIFYCFF